LACRKSEKARVKAVTATFHNQQLPAAHAAMEKIYTPTSPPDISLLGCRIMQYEMTFSHLHGR
jgi:hypothetical protein